MPYRLGSQILTKSELFPTHNINVESAQTMEDKIIVRKYLAW